MFPRALGGYFFAFGGGGYLGGWCFLVLGGNRLTFSILNPSNLPENLPVANINNSLVTYHFKDKLRHFL